MPLIYATRSAAVHQSSNCLRRIGAHSVTRPALIANPAQIAESPSIAIEHL